jgi:hypothetical protein
MLRPVGFKCGNRQQTTDTHTHSSLKLQVAGCSKTKIKMQWHSGKDTDGIADSKDPVLLCFQPLSPPSTGIPVQCWYVEF